MGTSWSPQPRKGRCPQGARQRVPRSLSPGVPPFTSTSACHATLSSQHRMDRSEDDVTTLPKRLRYLNHVEGLQHVWGRVIRHSIQPPSWGMVLLLMPSLTRPRSYTSASIIPGYPLASSTAAPHHAKSDSYSPRGRVQSSGRISFHCP